MAIFMMVFIMSGLGNIPVARAQAVDESVCLPQVFVSDDTTSGLMVDGHAAVDVNPVHPGWTALVPGSSWVWAENPPANMADEVTETFTQTFNIAGVPADSELVIAADNEYKVSVNGSANLFVDAGSNHESADTHVIAASHLLSGSNTITFEVKNLAGGPNATMNENPAGLIYKITVNCTPLDNEEVCEEVVYMSSDTDEDLTVDVGAVTAVTPIHAGWTASIPGAEWVWSENPVSDTVTTVTRTFTKTFSIDGTPVDMDLWVAADNSYTVDVNGDELFFDASEFNYAADGQDHYVIPAAELNTGENTIVFEVTNMGLADSTWENNPAGLLYKLSNDCEPGEDPVCPAYEQVMARINFSKISNGAQINGWRNWGAQADLAPVVYVGGTNPLTNELSGNVYDSEEWFPLTNPDGSYINDPDFSFDVPGLAVQRYEGKVRVVLYGSHTGAEAGQKEMASGVVEIDTHATFEADMKSPMNWGPGNAIDGWSNSNANPRNHDAYVNDAANPMEKRGNYKGGINQYDYRFDRMKTMTSNKVSFTMVVTGGNDGFYAHYDANELECVEDQVTQ